MNLAMLVGYPSDVTYKNRLKRCIQTRWAVDLKLNEERKNLFGKFPQGLSFLFHVLESSLMHPFLIV